MSLKNQVDSPSISADSVSVPMSLGVVEKPAIPPELKTEARYFYHQNILRNYPLELKERDQHVVWKFGIKKGKPTKLPFRCYPTKDGGRSNAKTNDSTTWSEYRRAIKQYYYGADEEIQGIGYVFSETDPYVGVDFDNCIDDDGDIMEWALPHLEPLMPSYAEISQSGKGIKVWVRGSLNNPDGSVKQGLKVVAFGPDGKGAIEIYDRCRFFAVTGNLAKPEWNTIADRCDIVRGLYESIHEINENNKKATRAKKQSRNPKSKPVALPKLPSVRLETHAETSDSSGASASFNRKPSYDAEEVKEAIIPHLPALLEEWGLNTTGEISSTGWLKCHAFDREDFKASAGVNQDTGVYNDFGGNGESLGVFQLAIALGAFGDFKEAVTTLGERFNVTPKFGRPIRKGRSMVAKAEKAPKNTTPKKSFATDKEAVSSYKIPGHSPVKGYGYNESFIMVRFDGTDETTKGKKEYRPIHKNAAGRWVCSDPPGQLPLFNLERIRNADKATMVYVFEGEKCCQIATEKLGILVTTSAHGSNSANKTDWTPLNGFNIAIVPDNDEPGKKYAQTVGNLLQKVCPDSYLTVVELPGLDQGEDIVEWIERGGTLEQLEKLTEQSLLPQDFTLVDRSVIVAKRDKSDPHVLANNFISKEFSHADGTTLVYYKETFNLWNGSYYEPYLDTVHDLVASIKDDFDQIAVNATYDYIERCEEKGETPNPESYPIAWPVKKRDVTDVMQALMSETILETSLEPPCWIAGNAGKDNARPSPLDILPAKNCLIDLTKFKPIPHTPLFFNPFALDYDFDPNPPEPVEWIKFLDAIWPNDPQSIRELQKWFGYLLTLDTSQQKMMIIIGPPRCGKGTIANVLKSLLGSHNVVFPKLALFATNFGLSSLIGKPAAIVTDAKIAGTESDRCAILETILNITGEDPMTMDRKYKSPVTHKLPTRLTIMGNNPPNFSDASGAIAVRSIFLRITPSWKGKEDRGLLPRLLKELPGILKWAAEGRQMLKEDKVFMIPESGKMLHESFGQAASPVTSFVESYCDIVDCDYASNEEMTLLQDLFDAYKEWCRQSNRKPPTDSVFSRDLQAAFTQVTPCRPRPKDGGDKRPTYLKGIKMTPYAINLCNTWRDRDEPRKIVYHKNAI